MQININVGTSKHPMRLTAMAAVALYEMGTGGTYIVNRSEHINSLINRGLVRVEQAHNKRVSVHCTIKGYRAKIKMRRLVFSQAEV